MSEVKKINHASALVYLAGVEIPVNEISVSYGLGAIPQASITLPASEELVRFGEEDKVPIAIFYLDQWYEDKAAKAEGKKPEFRLLFDGEITGWSFSKTSGGDIITLSAVAVIESLSQMYAYFLIGESTDKQALSIANLSSAQNLRANVIETFPLALLSQGIFSGEHSEFIERPFDLVENMLLPLKIGGYPATQALPGQSNKIAFQNGKPTEDFAALLRKTDAEPRVSADTFKNYLDQDIRQSAAMVFWVRYLHKTKFDKRWIATPLEAFIAADAFGSVQDVKDPTFSLVQSQIHMQAMMHGLESVVGQGDSFLRILNVFYEMNSYEILMLPTAPYVAVGGSGAQEAGIPLQDKDMTSNKNNPEYRLGNFISKPMAYFALPPECNIIFPSTIRSFTWSENYAGQATRTLCGHPFLDSYLRGGNAGTSALAVAATTNGWPVDVVKLAAQTGNVNPNSFLLFPEEYFKGPVVNNVSVPSWYQFLMESSQADQGDDKKNKEQADVSAVNAPAERAKTVKSRYGAGVENKDLLSNFTRLSYFEERFKTRSGSIELAFNPYIIPSFPMVVLDKGPSAMHIQALPVSVSHSISSQGGMVTSVQYAFGRTLKEVYENVIQEVIDQGATKRGVPPAETFYATAPALPIRTLANTLQVEEAAAKYYRQTFYQGDNLPGREYVYSYKTYFKTSPYSGLALPSASNIPTNATKYEVDLVLKPGIRDRVADYNKAMQTISRPVCTLEQYIVFINGGRVSAEPFLKDDLLPADAYGVPVPIRIRDYKSAATETDLTLEHYVTPYHTDVKQSQVFDLRRDWVKRLLAYRAKIYSRVVQ